MRQSDKENQKTTVRLSLPKPYPLHETPWENSAAEGRARTWKRPHFLALMKQGFVLTLLVIKDRNEDG